MTNGNTWLIKYETDKGEVRLSPEIVKQYLVSGDSSKVTDQEIMMFLNLCRYQKLNPFLREAYLIKFGNEPATIVVGKDTYTKRAAKSPLCNGWEAGVVVQKQNGEIEYRKGTLVIPGEVLIGGWAKVYRKDWEIPLENTVSLSEYKRYTKDGKPMGNWARMEATMIKKVALVQALREALPEEFQGLYSPEEMPVDDTILDQKPIEAEYTVENETPVQEKASERQIGLIHQLKNELEIDDESYRKALKAYYNKESSKDLSKSEASDLIKRLMDKRDRKNNAERKNETDLESKDEHNDSTEDVQLPWENEV